jgi:adenosylcobinamide-GDP ribazoletransferase
VRRQRTAERQNNAERQGTAEHQVTAGQQDTPEFQGEAGVQGTSGRQVSVFNSFLAAIQFLLVTPAFIRRPFTPQEMGKSAGFYPLVGTLLGGILLGVDCLIERLGAGGAPLLPSQVRAALILAFWIILTGALHLDGFLDACDGLLGGNTSEQRLEIMRDERVGAYALAGGILLLLVKFSALGALTNRVVGLLLTPTLGRWAIAVAVVAYPYARSRGLGRDLKDHVTWRQALLATLLAFVVTVLLAWFSHSWAAPIALVAAALTTWGVASFANRRIPGLTGDIYGALNEVAEMVVLLVLVAAFR